MTKQDETQPSYDPTLTNTSSPLPAGDTPIPQQIGPYKIIRTIGEGGMGTVYEAEQESPKRIVALKVIRAGLASAGLLKRFELESQVLGRLQHPGIGQIYQAGTADTESGKRPYFAMEYVRGVDLRQHVNQKNLSTRERLDLLAKICDAVHHAHQKGVIHRDLKPGNILVDQSGQPKILDFGVARATDSDMQVTTMQTDVGQLIGTLQYMSPEQVAANPNDLDTRSDVYALGVIAYEILTGQAPYNLKNKMIHEAARIIREDEPSALSTTSKVFRGDIETIVVKAMEKEKERRYQSAAGLAEDVRRYLKDEPILARPQSAIYQLGKFAKRNKALAGGAVVAMTALVIGMTTSTYLYVQAEGARQGEAQQRMLAQEREAEAVTARSAEEAQRKLAEQREGEAVAARAETEKRADELEAVTNFQASMLSDIDVELMGQGIIAVVTNGVRKALEVDDVSPDDIDKMLDDFSKSLKGVNATNVALAVVDEHVLSHAVVAMGRYFEDQPLVRAALEQSVASTYRKIGLYESARLLLQKALDTRSRLLGDDHPVTLLSIHDMGFLYFEMGKLAEANPYLHQAIASQRLVLGDIHPSTLKSIGSMGSLLYEMGKFAESEAYFRESLKGNRLALGDDHPDTLISINNMGHLCQAMGMLDEAETYFREALEGNRNVLGYEHPNTLESISSMGLLLESMGKLDEAEAFHREALAGRRRVLGDDHSHTLASHNNMGNLLESMGKLEEAETYYRAALEGRRRIFGDNHLKTLMSVNNMGYVLQAMGKFEEAEPYYREALEGKRHILGDNHPSTLSSINNMGFLLNALGKQEAAFEVLQSGESAARRIWTGPNSRWLGNYLAKLGMVEGSTNRFAQGEATLLEAHQLLAEGFGVDHKRTVKCVNHLINLYTTWHATEPGKGYDTKAAEWRGKLPKEKHEDN